ncbi:MAG: hypothetical protein AAF542_05640 [Pseudomonadota bacterium]
MKSVCWRIGAAAGRVNTAVFQMADFAFNIVKPPQQMATQPQNILY